MGCPRPLGTEGAATPTTFKFSAQKDDSAVLAQVGQARITVAQIQKLLNKQSPYIRAQYQKDEAALDKFIDGQVRYALLAEKGLALGYDKDPEVADAAKKLIVQKLTRDVFDNQVKLADVGEDEIATFYQENISDYKKPAMTRFGHIFFAFKGDKAAALSRAKAVWPQVNEKGKEASRGHFRNLVKTHSEDEETKNSGGDLRYRSQGELESMYGRSVADKLGSIQNVNDISDVLESQLGYHIFKKLGTRPPTDRKLGEVRAQVKNRVYRQKRKNAFATYIDGLKNELGVKVFQAEKKKLNFNSAAPQADPHGHLPSARPGHAGH